MSKTNIAEGDVDLFAVKEMLEQASAKEGRVIVMIELSVKDISGDAPLLMGSIVTHTFVPEYDENRNEQPDKNFIHRVLGNDEVDYAVWHEAGGNGRKPGWYYIKEDPYSAPNYSKGPFADLQKCYLDFKGV